MTIEYEAVLYGSGRNSNIGFTDNHYDNSPSPLSIAGGGTNTLLGPGGIIPGASAIIGEIQDFNASSNPLGLLAIAAQGANLVKNASKLTAAQVQQEGYSILQGQLANLALVGTSGYVSGISSAVANIFSDPSNSSVNNIIGASASNVPANLGDFQNPTQANFVGPPAPPVTAQ